jgi:signal transduction histidine kinase
MNPGRKLLAATLGLGLLLSGIFGTVLFVFRAELRREIRQTVIGRDAAVLHPVARQQMSLARRAGASPKEAELLGAVLASAQQDGILAVAVFDRSGGLVRALPESLLFAELPTDDYLSLLHGEPLSRFHEAFPLDRYFRGTEAGATAPVLEVLLPLDSPAAGPIGFAQLYVDARKLGTELAAVDARLQRQTWLFFTAGMVSVLAVLAVAYVGMANSQRAVAERNERLARANFELTLAAKASALGQLTSHLIHGLQGSVQGLRVAMAGSSTDLASAARHAEQMQSIISEVIGLLGDRRVGAVFELTGEEIVAAIVNRSDLVVTERRIRLHAENRFEGRLDSQRSGLLCLIAANLIQNAAAVAAAGSRISVELRLEGDHLALTVADEGPGIPEELRSRLFEPGVSGRLGGTGLGLAISRLMARQMNGTLELASTSPLGSVFRATVPLQQGA